jgi:hypothetical protein
VLKHKKKKGMINHEKNDFFHFSHD